jgi:phage portal protein BeeE
MNIFSGLFRSRDKPRNTLNGSRYNFFFGNTTAGKPVNENTAMQMTAVYSCVRILSEAVAGLPLHFTNTTTAAARKKTCPTRSTNCSMTSRTRK